MLPETPPENSHLEATDGCSSNTLNLHSASYRTIYEELNHAFRIPCFLNLTKRLKLMIDGHLHRAGLEALERFQKLEELPEFFQARDLGVLV